MQYSNYKSMYHSINQNTSHPNHSELIKTLIELYKRNMMNNSETRKREYDYKLVSSIKIPVAFYYTF